jgi:hypothetical protein
LCSYRLDDKICSVYLKQIRRTADPEIYDVTDEELKADIAEKEVDPKIFETQTEIIEQEKATEESASVEEKLDTTTALVPGERLFEETEILNKETGVLPQTQTTTESVIVPEEMISHGVETNEEEVN